MINKQEEYNKMSEILQDFCDNSSLIKKMEIVHFIKTGEYPKVNVESIIKEIDNLTEKREYFLISLLLEPFGLEPKDIIDLFPIEGINPFKLEEKLRFTFETYINPDFNGYSMEKGKKFRNLLLELKKEM